MTRKYTKKEEKIRDMYLETNNISKVMKKFKLSRLRVKKILDSFNIPTSLKVKNSKRNEGIKELFNKGITLKEIGKKYEISHQRVSQILYSMGIEVRAEQTKSGYEFFAQKYKKDRAKLYEGYHAKSLKHTETLMELKNCKIVIVNKKRIIEKLKEENKSLKSSVYAIEEVAKLKQKVNNLRSQISYWKAVAKRGS